jgi:hypothetical protein
VRQSSGQSARILAAGPTHLNAVEDLEEIVSVPASPQPFGFDAQALGLLLLQEIEGDMPKHGEVLGSIARSDATLILVEGDIKEPETLHPYQQS